MSMTLMRTLVDGSVLEGGGQILRNAASLSALLHIPLIIENIRSGRQQPGLKNQHRTGLELVAKIANASLIGAVNQSTKIEFIPGRIQLPTQQSADSVTAGSTTLLLQIALPLLLFSPAPLRSPSTLTLLGGTNATLAPQIDYTKHLLLPFIHQHFGVEGVSLDILKRGYFPKGGGKIIVQVANTFNPSEKQHLRACKLDKRGKVIAIHGIAHFAKLPMSVGKEMAEGAQKRLAEATLRASDDEPEVDTQTTIPTNIDVVREENENATGAGSGIVLWAELDGGGIIGGSAVGRKGLSPEHVGAAAAEELLRGLSNGGCVDEWLQDQVVIFMALASGRSVVRCGLQELTLHTRTAIWLAEKLTGAKFEVEKDHSGHILLSCDGIGYTAE